MPGRANVGAVMRTWQLGVSIGGSRRIPRATCFADQRSCYASPRPCVNSRHFAHDSYSHSAWPRGHSLFSDRNAHTHEIERDGVRVKEGVADNAAHVDAKRIFQGNGKRAVQALKILFLQSPKRKLRNRE